MTARARRKARTRIRRLSEAGLALGATLGVAYLFTRKSSDSSAPASSSASSSGSASSSEPAHRPTSGTSTSGAATSGAATSSGDEHSGGQFRVQTDRVTIDRDLGEGPLDGAWWATSRSAPEAVTALLGELPEEPRVSRLALSMEDWDDDQPKTVQVGDRTVHLAWFAGLQRRTARITFENEEAATVVVLPPDTEQEAAKSALALAGEDRSSSELLQEAHVARGDDSDDAGRAGADSTADRTADSTTDSGPTTGGGESVQADSAAPADSDDPSAGDESAGSGHTGSHSTDSDGTDSDGTDSDGTDSDGTDSHSTDSDGTDSHSTDH